MTHNEQQAFVKAYDEHVGEIGMEFVADFVSKCNEGAIIPSHWAHTSILDAMGMWHEGVKFALTNMKDKL